MAQIVGVGQYRVWVLGGLVGVMLSACVAVVCTCLLHVSAVVCTCLHTCLQLSAPCLHCVCTVSAVSKKKISRKVMLGIGMVPKLLSCVSQSCNMIQIPYVCT